MSFVVSKIIPNVSRAVGGSAARAAAELANALAAFDLSCALTAAGCAIATTTTAAKTVATLTYTVAGKFFSKAATDNFWTFGGATSATTVKAGSFQKYLLLIDTSGAASVQEGVQSVVSAASVAWSNVANQGPYAPLIKVLGSTKAIVGTLTIATDATHTFVPGTTALNATGITATFQDGPDQSILPLIANGSGVIIGQGG